MTVVELINWLQENSGPDDIVTIQAAGTSTAGGGKGTYYTFPVALSKSNLNKIGESVVICPDFTKAVHRY